MSHFALVDDDDIVVNIIVCEKSLIESGIFGEPTKWIETDPSVMYNIHRGGDMDPTNETPLRGNYASIGEKYDRNNDVFYPPKPSHASWTIGAPDWMWKAPVPMPTDGKRYTWNEESLSWIEKT